MAAGAWAEQRMEAVTPTADVHGLVELRTGWEVAAMHASVSAGPPSEPLAYVPAAVPGTVAASLGKLVPPDLDDLDWWFRCRFRAVPAAPDERLVLDLGGIASLGELWLNDVALDGWSSMFERLERDVTALVAEENELLIACRSVRAALRPRRPRPRWRTRVVADQQLRYIRTTLIGRAPGFASGPAPVGPYRPVILRRERRLAATAWRRTATLVDRTGRVALSFRLELLDAAAAPVGATLVVDGPTGRHTAALAVGGDSPNLSVAGELLVAGAATWLPHTHGTPHLYRVRVEVALADGEVVAFDDVPAGFRSIDPGVETPGDDGLSLAVSGAPIFCRGVLWTPTDPVGLAAPPEQTRARLELLRDAGVNMVRIAGTGIYEDDVFHRCCDELGILVWQDMMLANMDYPADDPAWLDRFGAEAAAQLSRLARHPSTTVICGGSEVEQQATMLGLEPELARGPLTRDVLPRACAERCPGVPFVPSSPCGGDVPFRTSRGVAHYFGVGAYLRPLTDARRAEIAFASECLAFANVPEPEAVDDIALRTPGGISPTHPVWKRGVPRDNGAGWDFDDVRDHYLRLLYGTDPVELRSTDPERYLDLSRLVSGEVMADALGEWRREASRCAGALILQGADLAPGAGWGLLDAGGRPKPAYWAFRRACAPVAVWTTDEGLDGIDVHVANDSAVALSATLRLVVARDAGTIVAQAERGVVVPARGALHVGSEELLGRFIDAAYAYRFGPPGHDAIAVSLHHGDEDAATAASVRLRRPWLPAATNTQESGLRAVATERADGRVDLDISSGRIVQGVRVISTGHVADDAWFTIVPGLVRRVRLVRTAGAGPFVGAVVRGVDMVGSATAT